MPSARTLLLGLAGLAVVLVVAVALRVATLDEERIRTDLESYLSDAVGLEVRTGTVRLGLGWGLRIAAHDVRVANLPNRAAPHLLEAERVALVLRLWPLLRGRVECDEVDVAGAALHLEGEDPPETVPKPDWTAIVDGREGGSLRLVVREVEARRVAVWVGSEVEPRRVSIDAFSLKGSAPGEQADARLRGALDGQRLRFAGRLGPVSALTDPALPYGVQLAGTALGAQWEIDATLAEPLALRGIELAALSLARSGAEARATGRVADLRAFRGVDLAIAATVSDAALLDRWLGSRVPPLERLSVDGSLGDADGSLGFEGNVTLAARHGGAVLVLDGVHGNLDDIGGLDARFTLRAPDLTALTQIAETDLDVPALAPVTAEGRAAGVDGHLALRDVTLQAGGEDGVHLSAAGAVANLAEFSGVTIAAEFGAPDAAAFSDWLGRPLPSTGALRGSLELTDRDGTLGIDRLGVSDAKDEGAVDLDLEVVAGDLRGGGDIEVDAEISSKSLHHLGELVGIGLPRVGPAMWKGRVRGRTAALSADGTLRVADTTLNGQGRWRKDAVGRGELRVALETPELRIADFGVSPEGWAGRDEGRFAWAWSRHRLDLGALQRFDAKWTFRAARVVGRRGRLANDLRVDLDLHNGLLTVEYHDTLDESPLALTFSADVRDEVPTYGLSVDSRRFDVTIPAAQVYDEPRFTGLIDVEAELQGRGRTGDEIRRSLAGRFLVTGRDGTFSSRYARAFVRDLFVRILETGRERPPERYRCLKGDVEIERGVLHARDLFVDVQGVHLVADGDIDLADGRWDLVIRPRVYGPGLIGGGVTVAVEGPLAEPAFRARPLSLPFNIGETLATRVLSPLELAARPITGSGSRDPCEGIP